MECGRDGNVWGCFRKRNVQFDTHKSCLGVLVVHNIFP